MEESAIGIITICISNVMYASEQNDKAQAGNQFTSGMYILAINFLDV
jgi:hypothetical protein